MSKAEGKKIAIKFNLSLVGDVSGNAAAFTISGQEYQWLNGPNHNGSLLNKTYAVASVSNHPTETNSIILEIVSGFRNIAGPLTVSYNQTIGNLAGVGGAVASFEKTFTPTDLAQGLTSIGASVGQTEFIQVSIDGLVQLILIEKKMAYTSEYIAVSVGGSIQLIHIDDVNP